MVGINQQDVPNSMRGYCMKKMKRFSCPAGFALLLIPLVSLVVMYLVICMEPDYLDYWNLQCQGFPALVLWNFLPIFFTISLLYFITKHLPFSLITGGAVWIAMGLVNHNKILLRSEPFMPGDIALVRELMGIIDTLDQSVLTGGIAILVALLLLMMLSLVLFRRTKMRWYVQLIGLIAVVMAAVFSYQTVYDNDKYYTAIPVDGYEYNRTDVSGSRGFIFMFTYEIHNAFMQKPEEYQAEEYQKMDESEVTPADYDDAVKPHIIMVMSEAFSDISDNVHLSMEEDPLENFKKISEDSLMSGYAVTNIYGGGTVVSEYEALTGISFASLYTPTMPYYYVRKDIDCLPRLLSSIGYDTMAFHPGFPWFYNRQNVYEKMGFDSFFHCDNAFYDDCEFAGGYITEATTFHQLISKFENHLNSSDAPLFEFCVTIENHGGYEGKYGITEASVECDIPIKESDLLALTNYLYGVNRADEELGHLVEYLETVEEPVVLVYYGDHKPLLTGTFETIGYDLSGEVLEGNSVEQYQTPFLIWENQASRESLDLSENVAELGFSDLDDFSVAYLGSTLMELLGFDGLSPFLQYVNTVRDQVPIWNLSVWASSGGTLQSKDDIPDNIVDLLSTYRSWSYYKLFDDDISN